MTGRLWRRNMLARLLVLTSVSDAMSQASGLIVQPCPHGGVPAGGVAGGPAGGVAGVR